MSLTENRIQVFLPLGWGTRFILMCNPLSHYLQFHIKCNIRNADERKYISQMSAIDINDKIKHVKLK